MWLSFLLTVVAIFTIFQVPKLLVVGSYGLSEGGWVEAILQHKTSHKDLCVIYVSILCYLIALTFL